MVRNPPQGHLLATIYGEFCVGVIQGMGEINSRIILTEGKKDDTVHPTSEGIRRFSIEFLEETIRVWQSYSSHPLSLEDAEEIAENMVDLILFINELGEEEE